MSGPLPLASLLGDTTMRERDTNMAPSLVGDTTPETGRLSPGGGETAHTATDTVITTSEGGQGHRDLRENGNAGEELRLNLARLQQFVTELGTRVVQEWKIPTSAREVRSFLGLSNYFRNFIQGYASLAAPMTELSKKGIKWGASTWTQQCQGAFEGIKHALTNAPCLVLPDLNKGGYDLIADASLTGIGAVLLQEGHPVAYESRRLTEAQYRWTTTEQEMWAVVHALRGWRCYLEGAQFTVITDHNPLIYLKTQKNLSRKQARWSEGMQRFTFEWKCSPRGRSSGEGGHHAHGHR
jgi:hypothetical protein